MKDRPTVTRTDRKYTGQVDVQVTQSVTLNSRANLACMLMDKASNHAEQDGEDSKGRSKWRELRPEEVVHRCCEMADAAFGEFEARGWLVPMPDAEPAADEA